MLADPQTVGLGPVNAAFGSRKFGFGESLLKVIPGETRNFGRGALRLGLLGTQENVALDLADSQVVGDFR